MTPLRVGELFSGIAGASLAVHAVIPGSVTLWQSDLVNEKVRARHFPDAQQLVGDVRALDPSRLPRIDLLTAGFPCTDLSVAGKQAGLDGPASGLYRDVLRFCGARAEDLYAERPRVVYGGGYQPPRVLIENVPALLHYLPRLCADFRALGYGLTWTVCEAADAGLPHLRRRVFVLAELDVRGRGLVEVDGSARWQPEDLRVWPTPRADEARTSGGRAGRGGDGESVTYAVRLWPTATVCGNDNREGASPTSGDGLGTAVRLWASPRASDADRGSDPDRVSGGKGGIVGQVRLWASSRDHANSEYKAAFRYPTGAFHGRLSKGGISHGSSARISESEIVRLLWGSGATQAIFKRDLGKPLHVPSAEILQLAVRRAWQSEGGTVSLRDQQAIGAVEEAFVRELRQCGAVGDSSQGSQLAQQLTRQLGDTLRRLSHVPALEGGEGERDTCAALSGVRSEEQAPWPMREALPALEEMGRPYDGQDQPVRAGSHGRRLNADFVEALMGYPVGWTEPEGDPLPHVFPPPVRGRYPAEWDRSVPWPGCDWEPSRTLPDGPKAHGRAARLKALGNSWVPAQGALALRALLGQGEQLCLL